MNLIQLKAGKILCKLFLVAVFLVNGLLVTAQHQQVNLSGVKLSLKAAFKQIEQQTNLFNAINLYHHILETYNELDDVAFDTSTKIKIYYLPIITQLMEFCLNHLYRFVLYIEDDFVVGKNYKEQNKLGSLKSSLNKFNYKFLTDIDIDFKNAISHGQVELNGDEVIYSYKEHGTREEVFKTIKSY